MRNIHYEGELILIEAPKKISPSADYMVNIEAVCRSTTAEHHYHPCPSDGMCNRDIPDYLHTR